VPAGALLPGWAPGCRKPARCPVLSGTHPWLDWTGWMSMWCRSRVEGGLLRKRGAGRGECPQHNMGEETKFALYLGAIFSTLLRVFTYLFLRVVCISSLFLALPIFFFDCEDRHPSDGLNTRCPVSFAPISQPSLSHLVFPNNRQIPFQLHPLKTKIRRRQPLVVVLLPTRTRQAFSLPPLQLRHRHSDPLN
jgi:hypothetical protein